MKDKKHPRARRSSTLKINKIRFAPSVTTQKQCNAGTINVQFGKKDMPIGEYLDYMQNLLKSDNVTKYVGCNDQYPYLVRQDDGKYCCTTTIETDKVKIAALFLNFLNEMLEKTFFNVSDDILSVKQLDSSADYQTTKCNKNYMKIIKLIKAVIEYRNDVYNEYHTQFVESSPFLKNLHESIQTKIDTNNNLNNHECRNVEVEEIAQVPIDHEDNFKSLFKWVAAIGVTVIGLYYGAGAGKPRKKKKTKRRH